MLHGNSNHEVLSTDILVCLCSPMVIVKSGTLDLGQGLTHLLHLLLVCNSIVTFSIRVRFACHGINVGALKYEYSCGV